MTLAKEVDHEKDVPKAIETILCSNGFSKCSRLTYATLFFNLVCSRVSFSDL